MYKVIKVHQFNKIDVEAFLQYFYSKEIKPMIDVSCKIYIPYATSYIIFFYACYNYDCYIRFE